MRYRLTIALAISGLLLSLASKTGAIFLLLELDSPFDGIIRIPNWDMLNALNELPQ
jgi:hypothetical protein